MRYAKDDALPISETVTAVYEQILAEILGGERPPGSAVRDVEVARSLGVSRTPVREAILLLRNAGVLEVAASRFTRVAVIDSEAALQLYAVWCRLFALAVDDLLHPAVRIDVDRLEADHAAARQLVAEPHRFIPLTGQFFDLIVAGGRNPHLIRAIGSVAAAVRLAILSHPLGDSADGVLRAQALLLTALRTRDPDAAQQAMRTLERLGEQAD